MTDKGIRAEIEAMENIYVESVVNNSQQELYDFYERFTTEDFIETNSITGRTLDRI
jgi:hypothetical protein